MNFHTKISNIHNNLIIMDVGIHWNKNLDVKLSLMMTELFIFYAWSHITLWFLLKLCNKTHVLRSISEQSGASDQGEKLLCGTFSVDNFETD